MFVRTRSSVLRNHAADSFETLTFNSKKAKTRNSSEKETFNKSTDANKKDTKPDMKKLRYEVIKFGSSGLDGTKKEESMQALVVALGAKPPKKKYRNYAEILAEKKAKTSGEYKIKSPNSNKSLYMMGTAKWRHNGKSTGKLLGSYGKIRKDVSNTARKQR